MSANTVYCHIIEKDITVVSDVNGRVTNIVCPAYMRLAKQCTLKLPQTDAITAPLQTIAGRIFDRKHGTRMQYCEFVEPNER